MRSLVLLGILLGASLLASSAGAQEDPDCRTATPLTLPAEGRDGSVLIRVVNEQLETDVRICLLDSNERRVFDAVVHVGMASKFDQRVWVPVGDYTAVYLLSRSNGEGTLYLPADLTTCESGSMMVEGRTNVGATGSFGVQGGGTECEASPPGRPIGAIAEPPSEQSLPAPAGPDYRWGALSAVGIVGVALAFPRPRYFLLALFSRVQGPEVLDQPTRNEIYDLIRQNPGVNAHRVANTLRLGSGETRYHLTVLRRNRLLTEIRRGALRCYFPSGIASPEQLRATAVLHHAGAEQLYEAILARPDSSLTQLATYAGLRLSSASKALSKLVEGGLAERFQQGRELRVRPTAMRPLLPLIEANPSSEVAAVT